MTTNAEASSGTLIVVSNRLPFVLKYNEKLDKYERHSRQVNFVLYSFVDFKILKFGIRFFLMVRYSSTM